MNSQFIAYLKIALAMAIVGSSVVFGKLITSSFPVFLASELRFIISTIILIVLLLYKEKGFPSIQPKQLLALFLQALTGVFLFNIFMLYGLRYTSGIEAGIITSTLPAVVGVIAFIFLKEKLTMRKGIGILLAILGVLSINLVGGDNISKSSSLFGNILVFGAVLGEALFITLGKSVSNKLSPLVITTVMSVFGLLLFLPFSISEALHFDFSSVSLLDWMNILYFGVIVTVVAFLLMYQGLTKVSANSAGVLTSVLPLSAIILSFFILKEDISLYHILGMLLVFGAIFFTSSEESNEDAQSENYVSK
ncbi:DMT family transporter [Bacillus sp. JJ722]|uniref:DMT family transporter n=1 Tax=Bacillus sp. JJ722 TaxID=3122973 RepID=UPI002FFF61B0